MKPLFASLAALALLSVEAQAAAPQPTKPLGGAFFTGRWYEIARTHNIRQRDCEAPTYEFKGRTAGTAPFVMTCRQGSPKGKAESLNVNAKLPTDPQGAKFRVSALGGVLATDYWVIDRADDLSWAIMSTAGGNYVWILSRKPNMDPALKAQLLNRIKAFGYDMDKIVQPRHG